MKKGMFFLLAFCMLGVAGCSAQGAQPTTNADTVHAKITMQDGGVIELELYRNIAPITVDNFVSLAQSGYFNGKTFHRAVPGFVIQGGSSDGMGYKGSDKTIKGEFSKNGVENTLSHARGVISMARRGDDNNSASSQFFIVLDDSAKGSLDGGYAAFGKVTQGMDVVDAIAKKPTSNQIIQSPQPVMSKVEII